MCKCVYVCVDLRNACKITLRKPGYSWVLCTSFKSRVSGVARLTEKTSATGLGVFRVFDRQSCLGDSSQEACIRFIHGLGVPGC